MKNYSFENEHEVRRGLLPSVGKCLALGVMMLPWTTVSAEKVDTELVLLVDVSGSINEANFNLQRQAFADAFRSSKVMSAISAGCESGIAATLIYWAGNGNQQTAVEWMKIDSNSSANAFADAIP